MRYPVHYSVERPERLARVQLAARLIAFLALGLVGVSFGTIFLVVFLVLPVYAASRAGNGESYLQQDGPRVLRVIRWLAAICGWAGLVTDRLPGRSPDEAVHVRIDPGASAPPTMGSAMVRVLTGIPSVIVLALAGVIGVFVWIWGAFSILFVERVASGAFEYLAGLQRWSIRLLAYQASLVDDYPPFSFQDSPPSRLENAPS
jgi:hypothetical protein